MHEEALAQIRPQLESCKAARSTSILFINWYMFISNQFLVLNFRLVLEKGYCWSKINVTKWYKISTKDYYFH